MKFQRIQAPNPNNRQEQLDLIELYAASGELGALQNVGAYVSNDTIYYNSVDEAGSYTGQVQIAGRFETGGKLPVHQAGGVVTPGADTQGATGTPMGFTAPAAPPTGMAPATPGLEPEQQEQEPKKTWDTLPEALKQLYQDYANTGQESTMKALTAAFMAHLKSEVPQFTTTT